MYQRSKDILRIHRILQMIDKFCGFFYIHVSILISQLQCINE